MKKLPFTIIHKNNNIDFFFNLHSETKNSKFVGQISEELINNVDKFLKKKYNFRWRPITSISTSDSYKSLY